MGRLAGKVTHGPRAREMDIWHCSFPGIGCTGHRFDFESIEDHRFANCMVEDLEPNYFILKLETEKPLPDTICEKITSNLDLVRGRETV